MSIQAPGHEETTMRCFRAHLPGTASTKGGPLWGV